VALESAPDILTYREGAHPFFRNGRLQPDDTLETLFAACRFPVLVLKPLCESHRALELLERHPGSRVLWIFRGFEDTVRSASRKWSSGPEAITRLVTGRAEPNDWRAGGLTDESLEMARRLYQPNPGLHHANAILWYLRTRLVLDLRLFERADALLVKYEDLSTDPGRHFPRVFYFLQQPMKKEYLAEIHGRSVRRHALDDVPRAVIDACEALYAAVDGVYRRVSGGETRT
jgi:hypothetical protein